MRILQIHNKYQQYGGEDTCVKLEYELLKQKGNSVEQLFFDNKNISSSVFDKVKTGLNSVYSFSSAKLVEREIALFKPELIHVHNFFPLVSPSVFRAANKNKIPVVITIHNYRLICANALLFRDGHICEQCVNKVIPLGGIRHKCYRNSYLQSAAVTAMSSFHKLLGTWEKSVNKYIVLTEFGKNKFIQSSLNLSPSKVVVKPNFGTDFGAGNIQREDYYVFLGRLTEEKGIKILLDSVNSYNYKLKIIGDGPLKELVEKQAADHPNIEYVGFKDKNYIINQLKSARGLILPSIWYEGLPLTVIETLSTGTPIVISDLASFKELITDNYNGFYFKTGNPADLAKKIEHIDTNVQNMGYLYLNARKTFLEKYTQEKNYDFLMNIYRDVIRNYGKKENN